MTGPVPDGANESLEQARALVADITPQLEAAATFRVETAEHYRQSAEVLKTIKALRKQAYEKMRWLLQPSEEQIRRIRAEAQPLIERCDQLEQMIKGQLIAFDREQERIRRAEEERLQREERARQEAIRRAEEEKARKAREAAAEKARKEREEADRKAKEAADEEERQRIIRQAEERAQAAIAKGEQKAEAALDRADAAAAAPLPTVARDQPKVEGIARRKTYRGEVRDIDLVVAAAAAGNVQARRLIAIDAKALAAATRALGPELSRVVPGVVVHEEHGIAAGAR